MPAEDRDLTEVLLEKWGRVLRWAGLVICGLALVGGLASDQHGMVWVGALGILATIFNRVMARRAARRSAGS